MNESKEQGALAVQPVLFEENAENGNKPMIATATMPIAKFVSNEQLIAEEKFLASKESEIERRYAGTRGWLRVAQVSSVLGKLALYLYLDQLEVHQKQQIRHARERKERAERLTRAAVFGEWLYRGRLWFFHQFMALLRLMVIGREVN